MARWRSQRQTLAMTGLLFACLGTLSAAEVVDEAWFETHIRPVLHDSCYKCHSHETGKKKGGLLLDSRAGLLTGGDNGPAIVAGEPSKSLLITAISYMDSDLEMPPKEKLPPETIAKLTKWIAAGAPWPAEAAPTGKKIDDGPVARDPEKHWAFAPLATVQPPAVSSPWIRSPIDQFILQKIQAHGLKPAPQADKYTLIRRVSYQLTGMPPTPEEIEQFLADTSADALGRLVDHYLASPAFGEHWARHWLDLVRYAETRGHEFDAEAPNAWRYRDYVVRALNDDVPYDRLVREHIAGDLLPDPRPNREHGWNEAPLGTGFWYLGEVVHSPVDIYQDELERIDNQIDVMGKAFLGVTIGCARCHDHKFDPISHEDYFSLAGIMRSTQYHQSRFETAEHNQTVADRLRELTRANESTLRREFADVWLKQPIADYLLAAIDEQPKTKNLEAARTAAWRKLIERAQGDNATWLSGWAQLAKTPAAQRAKTVAAWKETTVDENGGATVLLDAAAESSAYPDGPVYAATPMQPGALLAWEQGETLQFTVSDRAAWYADPTWHMLKHEGELDPGALGYARAGRTLRLPAVTISEGTVHLLVRGSGRIHADVGDHVLIRGPLHGALVANVGATKKNKGKVSFDGWRWVTMNLKNYAGARVRFAITPDKHDFAIARIVEGGRPTTITEHLSLPAQASVQAAAEVIANNMVDAIAAWRAGKELTQQQAAIIATALAEPNCFGALEQPAISAFTTQRAGLVKTIKPRSGLAMTAFESDGVDWQIAIRGIARKPGATAPRRLPTELYLGKQKPITIGSGRREIAERVTSQQTPLFARVFVNRVWHHLFGRGIVASVDNFGALGDRPTHPELLDWLATQAMRDGYSFKRTIRSMILTATWQQQSDGVSDERDPGNQWLAHARARRLSGEEIRDSLLQWSERLDKRQFGPSIPTYLDSFMQGRGRKKSGPLDGDGRRTLYLSVCRNFLSPMLLAFDTPIPFNCMGRRSISNVPAQALILMNDPFIVAQAQAWGRRHATDNAAQIDERLQKLFMEAYARKPLDAEWREARAFLGDKPTAQDWESLAQALVTTKGFIYVR